MTTWSNDCPDQSDTGIISSEILQDAINQGCPNEEK